MRMQLSMLLILLLAASFVQSQTFLNTSTITKKPTMTTTTRTTTRNMIIIDDSSPMLKSEAVNENLIREPIYSQQQQPLEQDMFRPPDQLGSLNYLILNQTLEKIIQKSHNHQPSLYQHNQPKQPNIYLKQPNQRILNTSTLTTTTTTTTSTTTTTTTTPTTTTPQITRLVAHITEFGLTSITYEPRSSQIMVSYLIRTNVSTSALSPSFQLAPTHATIEIDCRSSESDQQWSRVVHNQTVVTHYVSSSTAMLPSRAEPKAGSFIRCTARCVVAEPRLTIPASSPVQLLVEPAPVSNLFMKRVNETAVELAWMAPVYFYDYLDMICYLDEDRVKDEYGPAVRKIGERLFPKQTSIVAARNLVSPPALVSSTNRYMLSNLIPGAVYNCTLVSVRSVLNLTTRSRGETAYQMTELSEPELIRSHVDEKEGLVEIELQAPSGYYDYYTINLIELIPHQTNTTSTLLFTKNFTSSDAHNASTSAPDTGRRRLEFLIFNTPETLKSGGQYELTSSVHRRAVRALKFSQAKPITKLNTFVIRPEPIRSVLYFVKSNSSVNVTWQHPLVGVHRAFSVRHYSPRATANSSSDEEITNHTWLLVTDLAADRPHLVEIKSCADLSCHIYSEPVRFALELAQKRIVGELTVRNTTSTGFDSPAGFGLTWRLHPETESDVCDLSEIRVAWGDQRRGTKRSMVMPAHQLCPELKCGQLDDGVGGSGGIDCRYDLTDLDYNTPYSISISLLALTGHFEWPPSAQVSDARTQMSIPRSEHKTVANYDVNQNIKSFSAISIVEPLIDDSAGPIVKSRLYLVKLGSLLAPITAPLLETKDGLSVSPPPPPNRTEMFTLVSTVDQDYLRQVVALSAPCVNTTMLLEPCMLAEQPYERHTRNEKIVLIGRLASNENASSIVQRTINSKARKTTNKSHYHHPANTSSTTGSSILPTNDNNEFKFEYEHINTSYIEHSSVYQLFYVFEIGTGVADDVSPLYYATEPSEPIRTRVFVSPQMSGSGTARDKITLWVVVAVSTLSALFLIGLIATLIVLTLIKYKPSKFHKAAQIVTGGAGATGGPNSGQSKMGNGFLGGAGGLGAGGNGTGGMTAINGLMRSKFDRSDDFLDFVPPAGFSRQDMTTIWLMKHANGDLILDEEYRNLPDYRDIKTTHASQDPKNECKNRFLDIKAYDDSRVLLQSSNAPTATTANCKQQTITTTTTTTTTTKTKTTDLTRSSSSSSTNSSSSGCVEEEDESLSASISSGLSHVSHVRHENDDNGDYINANFVQGYSHDKKFIATQGPKKETLVDFWRMIYQYRVSAIVMLTKLVEKGVERCTQYWPDKMNLTESYGDYDVTMKEQQKCGDYVKRTFDLAYTGSAPFVPTANVNSTPGGLSIHRCKHLTVTQYYYPEWPDKETPSTDPISILSLIRDVNATHLSYQYPIVVHCSAGVGRTGTYITLDAMMDRIEHEGTIDIFGFISKIRERRQYLVQTSKQYIFIHEALYEYCLYGFTDIDVSHLISHYKSLKERLSVSSINGSNHNASGRGAGGGMTSQPAPKTRLELEFERLSSAFVPNVQAREAFRCENKARNRNLNIVCYDENRVRLSSLTGSSYINATKVKGYENSGGAFGNNGSSNGSSYGYGEMLITQDPMASTLFEFWKMITEWECCVIVALNNNLEKEKESVYWPDENEPVRSWELEDIKFVVQLVKPSKDTADTSFSKFFTRREFEIVSQKYSGTSKMTVSHFLLNEAWPEDRSPPSRAGLLDLVASVHKAVVKYDYSTRIAVHANGGGSNCSVFCALSILVDQVRNDQFVDVCRTCKKLKTQRPHMIETYEQYEFLYLCLVDFVEMNGIYNSQSTESFQSRLVITEKANMPSTPSNNKLSTSSRLRHDHTLNSIHLNID